MTTVTPRLFRVPAIPEDLTRGGFSILWALLLIFAGAAVTPATAADSPVLPNRTPEETICDAFPARAGWVPPFRHLEPSHSWITYAGCSGVTGNT